jgi:haloacetate dehalogenase
MTWHRVAPQLSSSFFVVCPDLRGYGQSTLPPDAPGHAQSSKRAMAGDIVALMRHLGHDRFSVVGHDRGALVAFRTAMDHPDAVERLVVMDGLPVIEHLERLNEAFVRTWWHWWFLGQTDKPAEAFINADPGRWYRTPSPAEMGEDNHADVWAAFCDPAVVHGMCEDYRAGLRIDRAHGGSRPGRGPEDPVSDAAAGLDRRRPRHPRRPRGHLATVGSRRAAQPPDLLGAPPGRRGAG